MRIKRTFFYVRPNTSVPFYHESANKEYSDIMQYHLKNIDSRLEFRPGILNDRIHYFSIYHPHDDNDLFKKVTHNLYFQGLLKESFKDNMRYTKDKQIAFALGISKIDHPLPKSYHMMEFYNIKPDDKKFIDATIHQKQALHVFNETVLLPQFYFIINFFDYKHNIKHVQTKFVDIQKSFWLRWTKMGEQIHPNMMEEKSKYNLEHNILEGRFVVDPQENIDGNFYTSQRVNQYLPQDLQNLRLPVFI